MAEDTTDDLFADGEPDPLSGSGDAAKDSAPAPQADGGETADSKTDERIRHWMSRAQELEAENNRLKGLDQKGKPKVEATQKSAPEAAQPVAAPTNEFGEFLRESVRRELYNQNPQLKDYGFGMEDVTGGSVADMEAAVKSLNSVIERSESVALNRAFEKLGIDPSLAGGPTEKRDFAAMSPEEFEKEIARAKGLI